MEVKLVGQTAFFEHVDRIRGRIEGKDFRTIGFDQRQVEINFVADTQ